LGILATNWQSTEDIEWSDANFNFDSIVNVTDQGIIATNWQNGTGGENGEQLRPSGAQVTRLVSSIDLLFESETPSQDGTVATRDAPQIDESVQQFLAGIANLGLTDAEIAWLLERLGSGART
jgi:hypothetical protein